MPAAREGHIAVMTADKSKMLVHGGINDDQKCFSDAFILSGLHSETDSIQSTVRFNPDGSMSNANDLKIQTGKKEMLRWFKC